MVKKKKLVHQNPRIVVLSWLALLKKQDWTFPYTTQYIYISQESHLNLRLQFAIQVTNGIIILAVVEKKNIPIS